MATMGIITPIITMISKSDSELFMQRSLGDGEQDNRADKVPSANAVDGSSLLLIWLSPAFPVGAFAYSHGLETAIAQQLVHDRQSLSDWLADLLGHGSLRNDMILLALAWNSVSEDNRQTFDEMNDIAIALQPSAERRLETVMQGNAFVTAIAAAWPADKLATFIPKDNADTAYPAAVALASAAHEISLRDTLKAYGIAFIGNLISAAIRLGVIGQTDGQRVQATLLSSVESMAKQHVQARLDDLGAASWLSDLCAMQHETQRTRLFRS